jgi:hypothetical protein
MHVHTHEAMYTGMYRHVQACTGMSSVRVQAGRIDCGRMDWLAGSIRLAWAGRHSTSKLRVVEGFVMESSIWLSIWLDCDRKERGKENLGVFHRFL